MPVEGGAADVVLADRNGRHQRLVTPSGGVFGAVARAAPTGGSIAVAVTSPSQRLVLVPVGGAGERVLINCEVPPSQREPAPPPCPLSIRHLDWSPDSKQIAFDQTYPAPMVRVLDLASGVVRDVRPGSAPFWSPDGRLLGSVSPGQRIEIGPPAPGPARTLPLHGVIAADWQAR